MIRPPFSTRRIRLVGETQRETALALLRNLPVDESKPLEVVFREEIKARGLDANGYYFLRVGEMADQVWFNGKQYSKDVWHHYLKVNVMPEEITTKDGESRSKWIESPDGSMVVISTTQLERKCFAEYTTACEAFGASLGAIFSEDPRKRRGDFPA